MHSRFRVVALLAMLSAVAFMRAQSGDHWPVISSPAAAASLPSDRPVPMPAVRAAISLDYQAPTPAPAPLPLEVIALGVAIGATSAIGRKDRGQMIIDSVLHVSRKDDKGNAVTRTVPAGTLLDDVDDDINLTDQEIDEFTARRVIRYATPEEVDAAERRKADREAGKVTQAGSAEIAGITARHQAERNRISADFDRQKAEALAKVDEQFTKEQTDAQQKIDQQVQERTAPNASPQAATRRGRTATSTAGAAAVPTTAEERARAMGGTHTPAASTATDVGAESKNPNPPSASGPSPTPK